MMNKKSIFYLCFCLFCITACSNKHKVFIEGTIKNADDQYLRISKLEDGKMITLDSAQIKNGKFSIKMRADNDEPAFFQLSLNDNNGLMTLAKGGEKLKFDFKADKLVQNYTVSGAKDAELMGELDHKLKLFIDSAEYLLSIYYQALDNDTVRAKVETCYNQIKVNHTNYLKRFIRQNSTSLTTIIAFYQRYQNGFFFSENDKAELQYIYDSLKKVYPNNEYVDWLKQRIESNHVIKDK